MWVGDPVVRSASFTLFTGGFEMCCLFLILMCNLYFLIASSSVLIEVVNTKEECPLSFLPGLEERLYQVTQNCSLSSIELG